ncbi:MAG: hypothetical protein KDK70_07665 [Myxococcales bacterium]|nr:hypothetical protein [Myxococcales bacterium]
MRSKVVLAAIVTAVVACRPEARSKAPSSGPAADPGSAKPSQADDSNVPWSGPLVAGGAALVRLDDQGHPVETLTTGEAIRPRWLVPGRSLLFLRHQGQQWQLVRLDLPARTETVLVADLVADGIACPGPPPAPRAPDPDADGDEGFDPLGELDVHVDWDFRVGKGLACVTFMDRNENMADVRMQAKVRLDDHTVERKLEISLHCQHEDEDEAFSDAFPECDDVPLTVKGLGSEEPSVIGPFRVEEGRVLRHVDGRDELVMGPFPCLDDEGKPSTEGCAWGLPTFGPESLSPSGRWVVLYGNHAEGDYMHAQWLLLDAHRGELFLIASDAKDWPAPLTPAQLEALTYEAVDNDVVGESPMLWLAGDRLVIETQLIRPGEAVVKLPGYLAR